jgi:hypothetical protein
MGCAWLLFRAYRGTRNRLLWWAAICFACLTAENLLIGVDLIVLPDTDLFLLRNIIALLGTSALLYGLIGEGR